MCYNKVKFEVLKGKIIKNIEILEDKIIFYINNELRFEMYHDQCCCENVHIEDICGDIKDLIDSEILIADESSNKNYLNEDEEEPDFYSETWTFYKLATIKGYVDIRWYGTSNGYYSEEVELYEIRGD